MTVGELADFLMLKIAEGGADKPVVVSNFTGFGRDETDDLLVYEQDGAIIIDVEV